MERRWVKHIEECDGYCAMTLTHLISGLTVTHLFSSRLLDQVSLASWSINSGGYASAHYPGTGVVFLHWLAVGKVPGEGTSMHIDHINGDRKDSRDENLRVVPRRINYGNPNNVGRSSAGLDITQQPTGFQVRVSFKGARVYRPMFKELSDAEKCRDLYTAISESCDLNEREIPTRAELKIIATSIRGLLGNQAGRKLTDDQVRYIRANTVMGYTTTNNVAILAEKFGVDPDTIRDIYKRKTRKAVK